jgi:hypothetical protein
VKTTKKKKMMKKREYDEEDMSLFIKKFNMFISKRRPFKGDKKEKSRSKRVSLQLWQEWGFHCPISIWEERK